MPPIGDGPTFVPSSYTIGARLGSCQTSHVYQAEHPVFGTVALKLPRPEQSARPVLRRMFENEVAITVKLAHRYVVSAYDSFPTCEGYTMALELCGGYTLHKH